MSAAPEDARDRVGPYLVLRAIGAGGSARVDLARIDRAYNFQRHVVIKRPLEHLRADANVAESLRREARIGGRLRHPNLVAVLDAGTHDGYDYLALEYVLGTSLRALMQTDAPGVVRAIPLAVALGIVVDVCRALHAAHELADESGAPLGLVHRDVSPGNVLLGLDGAVKLADFGIAKATRVATLSGSMHGTVTYMAPEQCRGHAFDRRADIFSIGVILYELVTRRRLFLADNDVASLHRVLSGQVAPPRSIDPTLSPALDQLVMRATAHLAEHRFATARELADAIEGLAASEGHVLGARWLARTLEEEVGTKHAPWLPATTIVQPVVVLEQSLVELIVATPDPEEPIDPTFGPSDALSVEDGSVPAPPPMRAATVSPSEDFPGAQTRHGGLRWIVAVGGLVGVIAAIAIARTRESAGPGPTAAPAAIAAPTSTPTTLTPVAEPPTPRVETAAKPAAGLAIEHAPVRHKNLRSHQTSAPAVGSDHNTAVSDSTATTPTPPPVTPMGSNHAAWDRNLLLPSDKKP